MTHTSDTSPIQVTPGDFDALISNSSENGNLEPWLSALQKPKKMLVLSDEKRLTRNAASSPVFACILFSILNLFEFVHLATEIQGT